MLYGNTIPINESESTNAPGAEDLRALVLAFVAAVWLEHSHFDNGYVVRLYARRQSGDMLYMSVLVRSIAPG